MRALVERSIGNGRRVTVNPAESPLAWLKARGLVDARQVEAGERLRGDYETATLGPRVTMRWSTRVDGGGGEGLDPTMAQIAAKRRFDAAIAAAGTGLADILWRVVCAGEAIAGRGKGPGLAGARGPRGADAGAGPARGSLPVAVEEAACGSRSSNATGRETTSR